jgi:hypothetical protein
VGYYEAHAVESSAHRQEPEDGVRVADGNGPLCGFYGNNTLKQETLGENSPTVANHVRPVAQSVLIVVYAYHPIRQSSPYTTLHAWRAYICTSSLHRSVDRGT